MKTTIFHTVILAAVLSAGMLLTAPAMASDGYSDSGHSGSNHSDSNHSDSNHFDTNDDGQITFPEVMQKLEKSARKTFDAMDHNKDGVLSKKDFDDVREGMQKLEDWLHDLLKPFIKDDESGPMSV